MAHRHQTGASGPRSVHGKHNRLFGGFHGSAGPTSGAIASQHVPGVVHRTHPEALQIPPMGVSASVGHDHWANDVLNAVGAGPPSNPGVTPEASGSNSPSGSTTSTRSGGAGSPTENVEQVCQGNNIDHVSNLLPLERKILEKKRKFHIGRPLELKNLPDGCTEQDIRDALSDLAVVSVTIETNDGRYKASARLSLEFPEVLDDWPDSKQHVFVKNKEVSVCVGNSDGWLCVAKLPLDYTDDDFSNLAGAYGKVREAFLMISEKTGHSKGYGLIKYVSSDAAAQARHLLDGRTVTCPKNPQMSYSLDCDWLNSSHISFKSLHSKALLVNCLPPNYRDMGEFRRIFTVSTTPPYCQIAMPKGVIQDWGLVEFFDPEDTEAAQVARNGFVIQGHAIRVHYCIPGVNAINIYMQAVNAPPDSKKKALLNDGPTANVYTQLSKLTSQNPAFAQNLKSIIQDQITSLASGQTAPIAPQSNTSKNIPHASTVPLAGDARFSAAEDLNSALSQQQAVAALAQNPQVVTSQAQGTLPAAGGAGNNINSNAQAALMILLTAQMQSQSGEASILQNPQVVSILQNLVSQAGDPNAVSETVKNSGENSELLNHPALSAIFGQNAGGSNKNCDFNQLMGQRTALLDVPKPQQRPAGLLCEVTNGFEGMAATQPPQPQPIPKDPSAATTTTRSVVANNLNNLLNAQNLSQLLGSITGGNTAATANSGSQTQTSQSNPQQRPVLLGDPPQNPKINGHQQLAFPHGLQNSQMAVPPPSVSAAPTVTAGIPTAQRSSQDISTFMAQAQAAAIIQQQAALAASNSSLLMGYPGMPTSLAMPPQMATGGAGPGIFYGAPPIQPFGNAIAAQAPPALYGTNGSSSIAQPITSLGAAFMPQQAPPSSQSYSMYPATAVSSTSSSPQTPTAYIQRGAAPYTPIGSKRKPSIPPSPEDSPQGGYIGQHSQGIGGHYADSYWRNKGNSGIKRPRF